MALQTSWPGPDNVTDQTEARKDLAGLILRDTSGNARPGIFPRASTAVALVTARGDMQVDIAAFEGVTVRGGGPLFQANDGTAQATIPTAPGANSRYDIVLYKQNETASPYTDANDNAVFPVYSGAASASPVLATAIADALTAYPGAHPLAAVLMPTGKTATNAVGVVITQLFNYTALSGTPIVVRTTAELAVVTGYARMDVYRKGTLAWCLADDHLYQWNGTAWVILLGDTGWIAITLLNSWTTTGFAGFAVPRYRRINGIVHLEGIAGAGTTTTDTVLFALPAGFRPALNKQFSVATGAATGSGRIEVQSGGNVTAKNVSSSSTSFNGVIFPAEA